MNRFWLIPALGIALLLNVIVDGQANESTPVSTICSVEAISPALLEEIVARGVKGTPLLEETTKPVLAGDLVAIFEVVTQSVECANANSVLQSLSLYSERYLAERFEGDDGSIELGHLLAAASRDSQPAAPEDLLVLLSVRDAVMYADGRIGINVTTANADATFNDLLILAKTGSEWRIDQVVLGDEADPPATPTSSQDR